MFRRAAAQPQNAALARVSLKSPLVTYNTNNIIISFTETLMVVKMPNVKAEQLKARKSSNLL